MHARVWEGLYAVRGHNNVQRAPLIQLPAWAGTRCRDYEIHGRPWGLRLRPLSGRHSPDVATKLSTMLTNLTESVGKEDSITQLPPPQAARGGRWETKWGHVLKAQGLKRRTRGPRLCNTEDARGGWETDRQTDFSSIIVRLPSDTRYTWMLTTDLATNKKKQIQSTLQLFNSQKLVC